MHSTPRFLTLASSFLFISCAATVSSALDLFAQPQLLAVGDRPMDLAVGNLDGNPLPEVVVANSGIDELSMLCNPGGPNAVERRVAAGGLARVVAIGDLNGDGHADIAVGREPSMPTLAVLYNRGDGTFDPPSPVGTLDVFPDAIWIGDLDADSDRDLVLASAPSNVVVVFQNDGAGGFTETTYITDTAPAYPSDLAVADADDDGDPDLLVTASLSVQPPVLFLNLGNGTFAPYITITDIAVGFVSAAAGELTGEGGMELVLLDFGSASLAVFPNGGGGTFGDPAYFAIGATTDPGGRVRLGDLDMDGNLDAVVGLVLQNPVIPVLLGDSDGGLRAATSYSAGAGGISAIALADLDGDGDLDVAATSNHQDALVVLRNLTDPTTAAPPAEDASGFFLGAPRPNPGRAPAIAFRLPAPAQVRFVVHDVAGRVVARLLDTQRAAGRHEVVWHGMNASGARAAAGVYYLHFEADGFEGWRTVVLTH